MSARILLRDADKKHARGLARVLRAASPEVEIDVEGNAADADLVVEVIAPGVAPELGNGVHIVVLHEGVARADLAEWLGSGRLHFVLAQGDSFDDDLLVTAQKLLRKSLFGLDKYFPWGAQRVERVVSSSLEREVLLGAARDFGSELGVQPRDGRAGDQRALQRAQERRRDASQRGPQPQ